MLQIDNLSVQALDNDKFAGFMRFTSQAVLADENVSEMAHSFVKIRM